MGLDLERVRANVLAAGTEDLLDRATVYRDGMEPEALDLIDAELRARGVGPDDVLAHRAKRAAGDVPWPDGLPRKCCRCDRPAVAVRRGWHRLWGRVPLFPRWFAECSEHQGGK
jgi:hypothetical protein